MSQSTIFRSCQDGATPTLALTSTLGSLCFLLKDTTWCPVSGSNPGPLDLVSDAPQLGHHTPTMYIYYEMVHIVAVDVFAT